MIPVPWTFVRDMTERHALVAGFLCTEGFNFEGIDWLCDGHECPSYGAFFGVQASACTEHVNPLLHGISIPIGKTCALAKLSLNMRPVLVSGWMESKRFAGHENTITRQLGLPMGTFGSVNREHCASRVLSENLSIRRSTPVCGSS